MRSFSLYSDRRWNGFSKTEGLGKQLSFAIMYTHSIFIRAIYENKSPDFGKKIIIIIKRTKLRINSDMLNITANSLGYPFLK